MAKSSKILICCFLVTALFSLRTGNSQSLVETKQAMNNLQQELTTCVAYYQMSMQCVKNRNLPVEDQVFLNGTDKISETMLKGAFDIGSTIGMTDDAMRSRLKLELSGMLELLNKDCVNFSSILSRYGKRCAHVYKNPDAILEEYLKGKKLK